MVKRADTRDVALAIASFLEGQTFETFVDVAQGGEIDGDIEVKAAGEERIEVTYVDVSEPSRPLVRLSDGQLFRLTITPYMVDETKSEVLTYAVGDWVRLTDEMIALGWPAIAQVVHVSPVETSTHTLVSSTGLRLRVHTSQIGRRADKGEVTAFKTSN